ncbi:MAG: hypothetical protein U1E65_30950 [Myxococcota bacterium]
MDGRALVPLGDGMAVADADQGTVAFLDARGQLRPTEVGQEPARLLALGDKLYVSLRRERAVAELSLADHRLLRKLKVGAEPFGLVALRGRLFVACALEGTVEELDLDAGRVVQSFAVPDQPRWITGAGSKLYVVSGMAATLTEIDVDQGTVTPRPIPTTQLQATNTIDVLRFTGDPSLSPDEKNLSIPSLLDVTEVVYYDNPPQLVPLVVDVPIDAQGAVPELTTMTPLDLTLEQSLSYPTSVAQDPASGSLIVAFEGTSSFLMMPAQPSLRFEEGRLKAKLLGDSGFSDAITAVPGGILARSRISRTISRIVEGTVQPVASLGESGLSRAVEDGRRLFFTQNPQISSCGITCSSCHFEGRTDGVTWSRSTGQRQTPSLAEMVAERAPLRWTGDRATIAEDAMATSKTLGGRGLNEEEAAAVEAFVRTIPGVDLPLKGRETREMDLGKQAFSRAGCQGCHGGAVLSDLQLHQLGGPEALKTPSLVGVSATGPFLHDGSIAKLSDLVDRAKELGLGDTTMLSTEEKAALVTYLESL